MQLAWSYALGKAMRRRDFIKVVPASAIAWPFAVLARQPMPVLGWLGGGYCTGLTRLVEVQYVAKHPQSERKTLYCCCSLGEPQ
jgi:hypothetical protein